MMKKSIKISFFLYALLFAPAICYCQSFFKNTLLTSHIAFGKQDKRLFNFPGAQAIMLHDYKHDFNRTDYEFGFTLHKPVVGYKFLQTMIGVGYAMSNGNFPRPFDHNQIGGSGTDELRYVKDYRVHQFILPFTFNIYLNAKKSVFINTIFRPAFTFNKTAIDNLAEKRVSKWKFEYSSFEVLPGLGTQIGQHWWLNLNYRWYYIHKLDRVIFNSILNPPQSFIEKKYDTYNPFQIQLTVGYWIKKK